MTCLHAKFSHTISYSKQSVSMSGIGEAMAGVAVAASFTQLLAYMLATAQTLKSFYQNMKDAPRELKHVEQKVHIVHDSLRILESCLLNFPDIEPIGIELQ